MDVRNDMPCDRILDIVLIDMIVYDKNIESKFIYIKKTKKIVTKGII
jgi:hypothetical protein